MHPARRRRPSILAKEHGHADGFAHRHPQPSAATPTQSDIETVQVLRDLEHRPLTGVTDHVAIVLPGHRRRIAACSGVEALAVERAVLKGRTPAIRIRLDVKSYPPDWAPWSLMGAGTVVMLYSFTIPSELNGG